MLCDQCFLRNALIHITNIRAGQMSTRHLCQECAAEEPFNLMSMGGMMKGLVFFIEGTPETKQKTIPRQHKELECGQCRYRLSDFKKTQKVGCPACYEVFKDYLTAKDLKPKQTLSNPPAPEVFPSLEKDDTAKSFAGEWELLQGKLYRALKEENYEEAAKLRDQLRASLSSSTAPISLKTQTLGDERDETSKP